MEYVLNDNVTNTKARRIDKYKQTVMEIKVGRINSCVFVFCFVFVCFFSGEEGVVSVSRVKIIK